MPEAHPPSNPREFEGCAWLRAVVRPQLESMTHWHPKASFHTRRPRVRCMWVCKVPSWVARTLGRGPGRTGRAEII